MGFLQTVLLVARKDLLVEFRSREILYTTLFFAVACVLVFAFGFVREGQPVDDVTAGILWIAIAFSGTLALGRAFDRERAPSGVIQVEHIAFAANRKPLGSSHVAKAGGGG